MSSVSQLIRTPIPLELYERALLIRAVEQRLLDLFSEGKLFGTVHTCIGQEWVAVAVAEALKDDDLIFSNHRCHGHFLARTDDVEGLIAEIMGKQTGICGGRGGSQHLCAQGFYSNGIQGSTAPVAAGLALAQQLEGDAGITVLFIGDGTLGEGTLYETLNIASKWNLPLLIVLENNEYAQSTSRNQTMAGDICQRAEAFGIETAHTNVWDVGDLLQVCAEAVDSVRSNGRPFFVRADSYRLMAHSKGDDNRDPAEVEQYWERDTLARFRADNPQVVTPIDITIRRRIDNAVSEADLAPYSEVNAEAKPAQSQVVEWDSVSVQAAGRVVDCIHDGLRGALEDERVIILGEDIESPYGGAFKVTRDLSDKFPGRVRNMPISEAAIVGLGNGLALSGRRPICEIMFGDFLALAMDQIVNSAAKFQYMYNDQVQTPVIVRTPMGGKRGYGSTHSQSLEKHFLGIPGTTMLALHHRYDPGRVYTTLLATIDRPTIVIENKLLYGQKLSYDVPEGFVLEHSKEGFPTTRIRPLATPDVTIVCYGGMLLDVEQSLDPLFEAHDIVAEIIAPMRLYPLNIIPIIESLEQSRKLLVVEEGVGFSAFGAEVIAQISESRPELLEAIGRVGAPEHAIPSCGPLEKEILPSAVHVVEAARELTGDE